MCSLSPLPRNSAWKNRWRGFLALSADVCVLVCAWEIFVLRSFCLMFIFLIGLSGVVWCRRDVAVVIIFRLGGRYFRERRCKQKVQVNNLYSAFSFLIVLFPFFVCFLFLTRCAYMRDRCLSLTLWEGQYNYCNYVIIMRFTTRQCSYWCVMFFPSPPPTLANVGSGTP